MTFSRLSGAAALGFVVTIVTATAILQSAGVPAVDASHDEIATFVTDHATQVGIASAIAPVAWLLLLVFGAGAAARIWRVERTRGEAWSLVGLSGLVMQNCLFAGVVAVQVALLAGAPASAGFWDLHNALFELNKTALAVALIGYSLGGLRTATIHTWHGAIGLLGAALLITAAILTPVTLGGGPAAISLIGFAGFALWVLWLIAYGLTLLRDHTTTQTAAHQEPTPARTGN